MAGGALVADMMRRHNATFPEAVEALEMERRSFWVAACSAVAERHGLDDDDAVSHVLSHAINPPEMMQ
jgi:hypothetical protein